jgi:branched-chain amino acid transport system ATP-binding protein
MAVDSCEDGSAPVLELKGLSRSFGGLRAVDDVTLKIMRGDRKAIIGPNGAGKTTLFNLITGIFPASSGQILLFGKDVTRWPSHRRTAMGMARTFQVTHLFPRLTVLDNVLLAIAGLRRAKFVMWRLLSSYSEMYAKAHALLARSGFLERKDIPVRFLSHGEQRQLEIVLGLASDPKILLLDEPAAGLDEVESRELTNLIRRLASEWGVGILLIEHNVPLVLSASDYIYTIEFGQLIAEGTPAEISTDSAVRRAYLGTDFDHAPGELAASAAAESV